MELKGKIALVTGAGSGIGRATALKLAKAGAKVALVSRTLHELQDVATEIRENGGEAEAFEADVSVADDMANTVQNLISHFGGLDIVVVNAGVNGVWAPIDELAPDDWDKTISVNLRGTYLTLHHAVPHLKKKEAGSIVVVSSINGNRTFTSPGATAYSATKAAQVAMVRQLALELGKHHIRINAVCPGKIETEIEDNTQRRETDETEIPVKFPKGDIPLTDGKPGKASDVADVIAFLVSDQARHVTGTETYVDGGQGLLR